MQWHARPALKRLKVSIFATAASASLLALKLPSSAAAPTSPSFLFPSTSSSTGNHTQQQSHALLPFSTNPNFVMAANVGALANLKKDAGRAQVRQGKKTQKKIGLEGQIILKEVESKKRLTACFKTSSIYTCLPLQIPLTCILQTKNIPKTRP